MDADPSEAGVRMAVEAFEGCAVRQSGGQTTLLDGPLGVFISWMRLPAHESTIHSKAEGPVSGLEDAGVEQVTLLKWTRGVGKNEVGGHE